MSCRVPPYAVHLWEAFHWKTICQLGLSPGMVDLGLCPDPPKCGWQELGSCMAIHSTRVCCSPVVVRTATTKRVWLNQPIISLTAKLVPSHIQPGKKLVSCKIALRQRAFALRLLLAAAIEKIDRGKRPVRGVLRLASGHKNRCQRILHL